MTFNLIQPSADTLAVELFKQEVVEKSKVSPALSDIDIMRSSCELKLGMLDQWIGYVESVLYGKIHSGIHMRRMLTVLFVNLPQVKTE